MARRRNLKIRFAASSAKRYGPQAEIPRANRNLAWVLFWRPKLHAPVGRYWPFRIPGHLPRKPVGVSEIAGIATPARLSGRLQNRSSSSHSALDQRIHLTLQPHVVAQRHGRAPE